MLEKEGRKEGRRRREGEEEGREEGGRKEGGGEEKEVWRSFSSSSPGEREKTKFPTVLRR